MIIISIYREGGKLSRKIKNPVIRPLVAALTKNNVGHISLRVEIFPDKDQVATMREKYALPFERVTTFEREKITAQNNNNDDQYKRGSEIEGIAVTNSFWPQAMPSLKQHKKAILSLSPGVTPDFQTQKEDQVAEAEGEVEILHHIDIRKNIKSDSFRGVFKKKIQLEQLEEQQANLLNKVDELTNDLKTTSEKLQDFQNIKNGLHEKYEQINSEYKTRSQKSEVSDLGTTLTKTKEDLAMIEHMIVQENKTQQDLAKMLEDVNTKLSAVKDERDRLNYELDQLYQTQGKNPDHVIYFSNEIPVFDEEAILAEMERQRNEEKYAFVGNNCAHSVKKCLLAGLLTPVKKEIQERFGVDEKFFIPKGIEAPAVVMEWIFALQNFINQLQSPSLVKK